MYWGPIRLARYYTDINDFTRLQPKAQHYHQIFLCVAVPLQNLLVVNVIFATMPSSLSACGLDMTGPASYYEAFPKLYSQIKPALL